MQIVTYVIVSRHGLIFGEHEHKQSNVSRRLEQEREQHITVNHVSRAPQRSVTDKSRD